MSQTCDNEEHNNTPTCKEEISHWYDVAKDDPKNEKSFWKLRCYLNWCLKQRDPSKTHIIFKECCKSREKEVESRLDKEGWMRKTRESVLDQAANYIK
jgi:hypothetical protein